MSSLSAGADVAGSVRALTMSLLQARKAELDGIARRYGVSNVRVFGSVARGEARASSDVDLLVDVAPDKGLFALSAFAAEAEDLLGVPVQVVTVNGLKPRLRESVLAQAVPV